MTPTEDLLAAVVDQVWTTMLRAPVTPWPAPWPTGGEGLLAEVRVSGDWQAAVRAWCPVDAAEALARAMLQHAGSTDQPDAEDVEDAVGELVNVVAGSVKGALGGSSRLGLPVVAEAVAPEPDRTSTRLLLQWQDQPLLLTIDPVG